MSFHQISDREEIGKRVLIKNFANITGKLELKGKTLLLQMVSKDLLSMDQLDFIQSKATRLQQAEEVMAILTRNSDKISIFVECLREDKQDFIADQLCASVDEAKLELKQKREAIERDKEIFSMRN